MLLLRETSVRKAVPKFHVEFAPCFFCYTRMHVGHSTICPSSSFPVRKTKIRPFLPVFLFSCRKKSLRMTGLNISRESFANQARTHEEVHAKHSLERNITWDENLVKNSREVTLRRTILFLECNGNHLISNSGVLLRKIYTISVDGGADGTDLALEELDLWFSPNSSVILFSKSSLQDFPN